jgi:large subunit ribosomal protein L22
MEVKAIAKSVRISAKKARPLAKVLRGKKSSQALDLLRFDVSKTSTLLYKLIFSAVSNAKNNYNLKEDNLRIKTLTIDVGPSFKRYWFRSRGSADRLIKRSSHMAVVLEEINPTLVKKPVVAKPVATVSTDEVSDKTPTSGPTSAPKHDTKLARQANARKVITTRTTNK